MRKFRSWGSNKAKPDAGPALSDQRPSAQWQTTEPSVSQEGFQSPHLTNPSAAGHNNLSDEELRAMEESALEYAIQQSQQADSLSQQASDQQASNQQAMSSPAHEPESMQSGFQQAAYTPFQANTQPLPEQKKKGMAKLKQRFSLNKQLSQNLPNPNPGNPYAMAAGGHHPGNPRAGAQQQPPSASWGSHSSQANPPAAFGTPQTPSASGHDGAAMTAAMTASAADEAGRLSEHRSMEQQQQQEEEAMMELAIKESEVQAGYDNVLREAKLLRLDLQHSLTKLLENKDSAEREHAELSELMGEFGLENAKGKGVAADHATERQFVESEYNLQQADTRVTAVNGAISELQNLEHFICSTKPPQDEAVTLTEEIVRQLLERLNFLKLNFAPPAPQAVQQSASAESAAIVDKFRQQQRQLPGPATPERPTQAPPRPRSPVPAEEDDFAEPAGPSTESPREVLEDEEAEEEQQPQTSASAYENPFEDEQASFAHVEEEQPAEPSNTVPTPEQSTNVWGQAATQSRLPEGATAGRLPDDAFPTTLPEQAASSSHMGTGSSTPSHVTDDSVPDSGPGHVTEAPAPNPTPNTYLPTSPTSVTSPHALAHMDSHRSTRSNESTSSNGNLAMTQSKEQSRQLLEKASQKLASLLVNANDKNFDATRRPGEAAIRRAPQVVHLYQELRRLMGDDFMVKELNSQNPRDCILQGMQPYQAPSPAEEQARQRALAAQPSALRAAQSDADKQARMLNKLGAVIKTTKLRSMPEAVSFVQEAQEQLAVLRADEGLVVAQLDSWPKSRLDVLREAAGQYQELNYITMKYKKWMLQQGSCLQEAERIEEFFDTARARVEWLGSRQEVTERRFATHQVPWDRSAFKTTRHAGLHLGVIYMSRILFEVANLERSTTLRNEECLLLLADATRFAYKTHQFAGGFTVDSAELFGKVKRLTQYYTRSMDPTWLKDNTKFSSSNRQKWEHVARR